MTGRAFWPHFRLLRAPGSRCWPDFFVVAGAVFFFFAAAAFAEPAPRLGGALRMVAAGLLSPRVLGGSDDQLTVSVRVAGGAEALARAGFVAREAGPSTAFVDVAPGALSLLAAAAGVVSVEHTRLLYPTLDRSVPLAGVPPGLIFSDASGLLDGRGVIVGIVDTGFDFRHRDFRTVGGKTRVLALLDLASPRGTRHPELPDYGKGAVSLTADIDTQLVADALLQSLAMPILERDLDGHGTHVAGIAASSGFATGHGLPAGRYLGMAPAATIIAAKATRAGSSFTEEDLLTSLRFVFDRARAEGLPAVANLSLGAEGGARDGSSNLERALSDLVPPGAPGRALVISAGNGGSRDHHAGGFLVADPGSGTGPVSLRVPFPASAAPTQPLSMDLWFDGPPPAITLVSPTGKPYGPVAPGGRLDAGGPSAAKNATPPDATGRVVIDWGRGADPVNHRYDATFYVIGNDGKPVGSGDWTVVLDGGDRVASIGRWDAWLSGVSASASEPRFVDHLDEDTRCDYPAYATSAIVAGSFVSRSGWFTVEGRAITRGTIVGRASSFSGSGPSLDGRFLPDLAAPGDFIVSAMSSDATAEHEASVFHVATDATYLVADDGAHGVLRGTSMAAPHVAGAIALLFQLDPTLTTTRLRELLRASATVERGAPGYSTKLGFGRLDVSRAAALLGRRPTGSADPYVSSVGTSRDAVLPGESRVIVSVVPRDAAGAPLGPGRAVTIDADAGAWEGAVTPAGSGAGEGRYERVLIARGVRGTAAHITATVDGVVLASQPAVWFVADRTEVGKPFSATGGCDIIGPPRTAPGAPGTELPRSLSGLIVLGAVLALAGVLVSRRRR